MKLYLTCVNCPKGCSLEVEFDQAARDAGTLTEPMITVTGNSCPKGRDFGVSEVLAPVRFLTTTVALSEDMAAVFGARRLPVISTGKIPKKELVKVSLALADCIVDTPVETGTVVARALGWEFMASCDVADERKGSV